jgi:hypothetical protein
MLRLQNPFISVHLKQEYTNVLQRFWIRYCKNHGTRDNACESDYIISLTFFTLELLIKWKLSGS